MRISNDLSLLLSHQMRDTQQAISRSLERLSTGKRINSARDDVAGFSTLVGIDSKLRGLAQANLNINIGRGLITTADAAISVQSDIVQRMRELAVQASNGVLSASDRSQINTEISSLLQEYNRVTSETEFNGKKLLDGSFGSLDVQTGVDSNRESSFALELGDLSADSIFQETVGTGRFTQTGTFTGSLLEAGELSVADLDNDGDLDAITAAAVGDEYTVYLNDGEGNFTQSVTTVTADVSVNEFHLEDVNGDGIVDIIGEDTDIHVFLGNGDGTFQSQITSSAAGGINEFDLADVNGDGVIDLVGESGSTTRVFLGDGVGGFIHHEDINSGGDSTDIILTDLNGDSVVDIVLANYGTSKVSVLIGSGDGSFGSQVNTSVNSFDVDSLEVGDLDGDGDSDVLVNFVGGYQVFLNDGSGALTAQTSVGISSTNDADLVDMNGDGNLDFVYSLTNKFVIRLGNGDGTFTETFTQDFNSGTSVGSDLAVGDFDGDAVNDVASYQRVVTGNVFQTYSAITKEQSARSKLDINTQAEAQALIGILDGALDNLNQIRVNLSSSLSRLDIRENLNSLNMESYSEANSQVGDTDLSLEMAKLVQNQILQQAQIAAFSQSNLSLQVVLELLDY